MRLNGCRLCRRRRRGGKEAREEVDNNKEVYKEEEEEDEKCGENGDEQDKEDRDIFVPRGGSAMTMIPTFQDLKK